MPPFIDLMQNRRR